MTRLDHGARAGERFRRYQESKTADGDFVKVYPKGWHRLSRIACEKPHLLQIYMFFAQYIDAHGAVAASQEHLADRFGVSGRTIRTWTKQLLEMNAIVRIRLPKSNIFVYAIDPSEFWKNISSEKDNAIFHSNVLTFKNTDQFIQRKLRVFTTRV